MTTMNSTFNERAAVVGVIDPDAYVASGSYDKATAAIDMSRFGRVAFIVMAGDVDASGTIDFKLTESDASAGTYTDITAKAITQLTATDDDKQVIVEVKGDELSAGKRYIKGTLRTATAAGDVAVIAIALDALSEPANVNNLASVAQIVA